MGNPKGEERRRRVLLLCGDYMEDYEAMVPFQALQAFGVAVDAVSPGKKAGDICATAITIQVETTDEANSESRGHNFTLNATFDEIEFEEYDGLVIPGGRSPEHLAMNASVVELVRKFSDSRKPIAAICHGQLVLAAAAAVKGRKCTAVSTMKPGLVAAGAHWVEPDTLSVCVADDNLITGVTYYGNPEFIGLFLKALGGKICASERRVLIIIGNYAEDYEVTVPYQTLKVLGCHVDVVCPKKKAGDTCPTAIRDLEGGQTYSEIRGHNFVLTADFESIDASSYDALVLPGGKAPEFLALKEDVIVLVKKFMEARKPVASICHGLEILVAAGVLQGKKCTGYPGIKARVVSSGGTFVEADPIDRCVTDGNLVTAAAWHGQPELISQLMTLLDIRVSF
ncbi:hypothetical protein PRUPE_3G012900 [Prunus persica]|uniref:DJ-1/PfpI domain-containing protein n=1 Tax=Prunus persica TaxID=3760 RepID=A0A251PWM7_PRUPE|nr:protein DJ-1 homolog D-like [Prunus persica]XP_020415750.1 protein DJ-1 homolog D-like [Prunus persica]ONI14855.1 hypothetical protein PRUPE_3G012900 [Prunus persica]